MWHTSCWTAVTIALLNGTTLTAWAQSGSTAGAGISTAAAGPSGQVSQTSAGNSARQQRGSGTRGHPRLRDSRRRQRWFVNAVLSGPPVHFAALPAGEAVGAGSNLTGTKVFCRSAARLRLKRETHALKVSLIRYADDAARPARAVPCRAGSAWQARAPA
jgi:hypothetical protein